MKRLLIFLGFLFLATASTVVFTDGENYFFSAKEKNDILKAKVAINKKEEKKEVKTEKPETIKEMVYLPNEFLLDVAFTSQAPAVYGKDSNQPLWDDDHGEACEEAAIITAHYFYTKEKLTSLVANEQILAMLDFQQQNYIERNKDLESNETAKLAKDFYGYKNVRVLYDPALKDIKSEIYKGNPVILPTAGKMLGNPNYTPPGPVYHMLVAIGWNDKKGEIITNDPGTRMGEGYVYKYKVLKNALHEWNGGDVKNGRSSMILLK